MSDSDSPMSPGMRELLRQATSDAARKTHLAGPAPWVSVPQVKHPAEPPFPPHTPGVHRALWLSEGRCAISLKDAPEGTPLLADNIPNTGDALLFAAARDMYEALEVAAGLLNSVQFIEYQDGSTVGGFGPEFREKVAAIRATLAKAQGKEG